ncbi:nuclear transport factor 2 family protein [Roseomonas sp. GC11]|uniref:DUF4440 domain-containing protein n=1 Tax=Roseomonas sp. GC11 TaxID=2950546 RepID=UPI00210CF98C|nr:DUF4440 domain-containing protein [Roseomonas sp. GC11]MCQ4159893.1 nuclear transport factor 2 family protein [Roseomonas sp. GC11]
MHTKNRDDFAARAAREVVDLHTVLQAWFNAEGSEDVATVLDHFDEGFTMITPTGAVVTYDAARAGFAAGRGGRRSLVMEISDVVVRHVDATSALVSYRERQTQDGKVTNRLSTALLLDRPDRAAPVWRHLQETWQP